MPAVSVFVTTRREARCQMLSGRATISEALSPHDADFRIEVRTVRTLVRKAACFELPYRSPYDTDFRAEVHIVRTSVTDSCKEVRTLQAPPTEVRTDGLQYGSLYRTASTF